MNYDSDLLNFLTNTTTGTKAMEYVVLSEGTIVGRTLLLEQLATNAKPGRCLLLLGPAGVGKTRIAAEFARTWHAAKKDVRWINLVDAAPHSLPRLVLERCELGTRELEGDEALERKFSTSCMRWKEPLIVFDNLDHLARDVTFFSNLQKNTPNATFLFTSRIEPQPSLPWTTMRVQPLSPDFARTLLDARVREYQAEQNDADKDVAWLQDAQTNALKNGFSEQSAEMGELSARTGGLPLAIEMAAREVNKIGLHQAIHLFRDEHTPEQISFGRVVERSLSMLAPDALELLHASTHLPGSFRIQDLEWALTWNRGRIVAAIKSLHDTSLLRAASGQSFALYPLVSESVQQLYGAECAKFGARFRRRFATWSRKRSAESIRHYFERIAAHRFALERTLIHAGHALAKEPSDDGLIADILALLRAFQTIVREHGDASLAIPMLQNLAELLPAHQAELDLQRAELLVRTDFATALEVLRYLDEGSLGVEDRTRLWAVTALCQQRQGDWVAAEASVHKALDHAKAIGDGFVRAQLESEVLQFHANLLCLRGDPQRARLHAQKALEGAQKAGAVSAELSSQWVLGKCALIQGDFAEAAVSLEATLAEAKRLHADTSAQQINAFAILARIFLGEYADALQNTKGLWLSLYEQRFSTAWTATLRCGLLASAGAYRDHELEEWLAQIDKNFDEFLQRQRFTTDWCFLALVFAIGGNKTRSAQCRMRAQECVPESGYLRAPSTQHLAFAEYVLEHGTLPTGLDPSLTTSTVGRGLVKIAEIYLHHQARPVLTIDPHSQCFSLSTDSTTVSGKLEQRPILISLFSRLLRAHTDGDRFVSVETLFHDVWNIPRKPTVSNRQAIRASIHNLRALGLGDWLEHGQMPTTTTQAKRYQRSAQGAYRLSPVLRVRVTSAFNDGANRGKMQGRSL